MLHEHNQLQPGYSHIILVFLDRLRYDGVRMDLVQHTIPPIYNETSNTLLLGTMPSPKSRAAGFYYAHPKNRFWPTLAAVYNEPVTRNNHERRSLILRHHLALWDVLDSCEICGAADASIRNAQPNDIPALIAKTRIVQVFCIGQMAGRLYRRFLESKTGLPCKILPSTSPANCRVSFNELVCIYANVLL